MNNKPLPNFLKRVDNSLVFALDDAEFAFFVPEVFFDNNKIASIIGSQVSLFGICNYAIFDKNGKSKGLKPFTFPTKFDTEPYSIEKRKGLNINKLLKEDANDDNDNIIIDNNADPDINTDDEDCMDYRVLRYKKGNKIVVNVHVPQSIDNVEIFFKLFLLTAKIPNSIPYDKLHEYFIKNADLNGFSYGLIMQLFGILVSEIARSKKDITKPFRLSKDNNMNNYTPISIKLTPKFISPFISITSENFDQSLIGAITTTNHSTSPLEKILMM